MRKMPKRKVVGFFLPDEQEVIFNDATFAAVVVHQTYGFNSWDVHGVIEIAGCSDEGLSAAAIDDEMEDGPSHMTPMAARRLAALLIQAADDAEAMIKKVGCQYEQDRPKKRSAA